MAKAANPASDGEAKRRNAPPPVELPTKEQIIAWLEHEYATMKSRAAQIKASLANLDASYEVIENDTDQALMTDARKQAQSLIDNATKTKVSSKKPLREMATWFDEFFTDISVEVEGALDPIRRKMTAYAVEQDKIRREAAKKEHERLAEEAEAARKRAAVAMFEEPVQVADRTMKKAEQAEKKAERAAAAVEARPADRTRVTGEFGATSSLREFLEVEVADPLLVPPEFLKIDLGLIRQKAREMWADPDMKVKMRDGHQPIRGVKCTIRQETVVR